MEKRNTVYMVRLDGEDEQFYNQYDPLEDTVSDQGDGVEVFEATLKSLGHFERSVKIVKAKKNKYKETEDVTS